MPTTGTRSTEGNNSDLSVSRWCEDASADPAHRSAGISRRATRRGSRLQLAGRSASLLEWSRSPAARTASDPDQRRQAPPRAESTACQSVTVDDQIATALDAGLAEADVNAFLGAADPADTYEIGATTR